ncbi:MAG: WecB/TagA/CpsF family glycosyltransferase [Patescibacteria group bacterium]|jgi:N-acetylglucosaminyldiphosphoundecaprenol N-acetyl-beta-D-mannosaminyltransferase
MRKIIDILGIKIDTFTAVEALDYIVQLANDGRSHYIVTPNPEFVMQSQTDTDFRDVVNAADLALPDGVGVLWAAKYLALPLSKWRPLALVQAYWQWLCSGINIIIKPAALTDIIPERVTGADMVWEISKLAAERNWKIFLVGGAPGVGNEAAKCLQWLYPNLQIAGVMAGPPYDSEEQVIHQIKSAQPKFIFLALTAPKQLQWIKNHAGEFTDTIAIGIGGALDFIAGGIAINAPAGEAKPAKRAPLWLQKRGLEWFWRYLTQPWRRTRIKIATLDFMKKVVKFKLAQLNK